MGHSGLLGRFAKLGKEPDAVRIQRDDEVVSPKPASSGTQRYACPGVEAGAVASTHAFSKRLPLVVARAGVVCSVLARVALTIAHSEEKGVEGLRCAEKEGEGEEAGEEASHG